MDRGMGGGMGMGGRGASYGTGMPTLPTLRDAPTNCAQTVHTLRANSCHSQRSHHIRHILAT